MFFGLFHSLLAWRISPLLVPLILVALQSVGLVVHSAGGEETFISGESPASAPFRDPPYCYDLYSVTCSPGSTEDDTGMASYGAIGRDALFNLIQSRKPIVVDQFFKRLTDPNQVYFRNLVQEILGYDKSPECLKDQEYAQNYTNDDTQEDSQEGMRGREVFNHPDSEKNLGGKSEPKGKVRDKNLEVCSRKMAEGLFELAQAWFQPDFNLDLPRKVDYRDLQKLIFNHNFRNILKNLRAYLKDRLKTEDVYQKVQNKLFPEAQLRIIKKLRALSYLNPVVRKHLEQKIHSIQFTGVGECEEFVPRGEESIFLEPLTLVNASYNPMTNELRVCNGLGLSIKSEYSLLFTVAHELAHSIDPCDLGDQFSPSYMAAPYNPKEKDLKILELQYPLSPILQCLRDPRSIQSVNPVAGPSKWSWILSFFYSNGLRGGSEMRGGGFKGGSVFCAEDQSSEHIADWFATEVIADRIQENSALWEDPTLALKALSNVWKMTCPSNFREYAFEEFLKDQDVHLVHGLVENRVNRLFLQHPVIRSALGCRTRPWNVGYCNGIDRIPVMGSIQLDSPRGTQ